MMNCDLIGKAIKRVVDNPSLVERIIRRGGILGAKVVYPAVGSPISDKPGAQVVVLRGSIVMHDPISLPVWGMPGNRWRNNPSERVQATEGRTVLLVR